MKNPLEYLMATLLNIQLKIIIRDGLQMFSSPRKYCLCINMDAQRVNLHCAW